MKKSIYLIGFIFFLFYSCNKKDNPKACFTYTYGDFNGQELVFSNCSENAIKYKWDFGDGKTSIKKKPKHQYDTEGQFFVQLKASTLFDSDIFIDTIYAYGSYDYKPNIYIYPKKEIDISVKLSFPLGGQVVKSIPKYGNSWTVNIKETGLIDNTYNFLFYESVHPDKWQYDKGWCIEKTALKDFFESNMNAYNFSEKEINDFTEYWIPLLNEFDYYYIYPQTNNIIDKVVELHFSEKPDNIGRLFYRIIGSYEKKEIPEAKVIAFNRDGFAVMEWGVDIRHLWIK